jgi:hypothetical protein
MIKIRDHTIRIVFGLSIIFLITQLALVGFYWRQLPPQGPLFYSRPWGERQLTTPQGYLLLPLASFLTIAINLFIGSLIPKEEKLISQLLVLFAAVFNFLSLFTLIKIIDLIT